ncbi:hypothetical protein H072_1416 [Dactylellina haptotyla CBS 200.50]|uniref:Uncharacterized protein n=1 Tax=Dactylellina haptotyla (strain CBS 200.50) TaxID=1284197 RepID=S8BYR3_DACHA|nr:hypothetical protein H072_1416 [Dactylellina haptotyla CBS 200.50]
MLSTGPQASLRTLSRTLPQLRHIRIAARRIHSTSQSSRAWTGRQVALGGGGGALLLASGVVAYQILNRPTLKLDAPSVAEKKAKLSSQHDQVMRFWDRPGVYLWGSNSGRVAAPDSDENFVKAPRRIPFFDGYVLKDLQLSQDMGVAVTERGDLIQWGTGYFPECRAPVVTFTGKNIVKVGLSEDRIVALSSSGQVYSIPFSKEEQELFAKPTEISGLPFWSYVSESKTSYRDLTPTLGSWEKIVDIAVGLEHTVMLTSSGRVFTAASATYSFPLKGQLGIAEMSWETKPTPYDTPQEVKDLGQFKITQIAAGNYHSVVADKDGKIFSWGDNTKGQLGVEYTQDSIMKPVRISPRSFYKGDEVKAKLQKIYAGGLNTFFSMEADTANADFRKPSTKSFDLFGCGHGLHGTLGIGSYVHAQALPQKIKSVSGLTEYSERKAGIVPINSSYMTVGGTHAAVVMSNLANVQASNWKSNDINFGNDILFFGGNEFYQLGNGKRTNANVPTHIPPMDDSSAGKRSEQRFQVVPQKKVTILDEKSKKRSVRIEQRVVAGRGLTGCYAKAV